MLISIRLKNLMEENFERKIKKGTRFKRFKDSELFKVVEEVFDSQTLQSLYYLMNKGYIDKIYGVVAAGKEARIYWAEDSQNRDLAVKIFLVKTAEFRRGRLKYIEGDPRFKRIRKDIRSIVRIWCSKEFRNLKRAYESGIRVPQPYTFKDNILLMEFINSGIRGKPAPTIKEKVPEDPEGAYYQIISAIEKLYNEAKLVHADLSEYNILNKDEKLYIIDWGSAVHGMHPHAEEFLLRDIVNITRFFESLGVKVEDPQNIYKRIISRGFPR